MPTAVKRDPEVLKKAAVLLQDAHDYIEVNGFDIQHYCPVDGKCCFIGTVRIAAGVRPGAVDTGHDSDAGADDGEELYAALEAMDKVARRRLPKLRREAAQRYFHPAGRFVEQLGFEVERRACEKYPHAEGRYDHDHYEATEAKREKFQKDYALKLLRTALTRIYA